MACTNVYRMIFINTVMRKRMRLWVKISKMHSAKYYNDPKDKLFSSSLNLRYDPDSSLWDYRFVLMWKIDHLDLSESAHYSDS